MSRLSSEHSEIMIAKDYTSLKLFKNIPSEEQPPSKWKTFYLRTIRGTLLTMSRDPYTNTLKPDNGLTEQSYHPWNKTQTWSFIPFDEDEDEDENEDDEKTGWLVHNDHYLSYHHDRFVFNQTYCPDQEEKDLFKYVDGCWIHIKTGKRITYVIGCGISPNHEPMEPCSKIEIVLARNVVTTLEKHDIFWCNTNSSEPLPLPTNHNWSIFNWFN